MINGDIFLWKRVIKDDTMLGEVCNSRGKISKMTKIYIKEHNKTINRKLNIKRTMSRKLKPKLANGKK